MSISVGRVLAPHGLTDLESRVLKGGLTVGQIYYPLGSLRCHNTRCG